MAASNERLRQAVLTLWQTSMLRRTRLTVLDEVANGRGRISDCNIGVSGTQVDNVVCADHVKRRI
jgi:hypothetical protein